MLLIGLCIYSLKISLKIISRKQHFSEENQSLSSPTAGSCKSNTTPLLTRLLYLLSLRQQHTRGFTTITAPSPSSSDLHEYTTTHTPETHNTHPFLFSKGPKNSPPPITHDYPQHFTTGSVLHHLRRNENLVSHSKGHTFNMSGYC